MNTKIFVCTHKNFTPPDDSIYSPLHVGRAISSDLGFAGDDTGDSISEKNKSFCELTGLYWIWKNSDSDIVGLCHYRRYLVKDEAFLTREYIEKTLTADGYDIIMPSSGWSPYETNEKHYQNIHFFKDYKCLREVLSEKYPEYLPAFDHFSKTNLVSLANIIITRKDIFDEYCTWLFDILFEVEKRTDLTGYDTFQFRLYGYLSERLLRIWLFMHNYRIKEEQVKLTDTSTYIGRLIFMTGLYDTLDIFTYELISSLSAMGYECLEFDTSNMAESLKKLSAYITSHVSAVITFNNLGFNMELKPGENIWDALKIPCINILMDHPYFHKNALDNAPGNAIILCPDFNHTAYVQRFYPNITTTGFLAHGGKSTTENTLPISKRSIDILYAGGISTPFIEKIMPDFSEFTFDAESIGENAYDMLKSTPSLTVEYAIEKCLTEKNKEIWFGPIPLVNAFGREVYQSPKYNFENH